MMKTLLNMGGGVNLTTRNDDGTFTTTANYSSSRNKGTKLTGLKDNTDYTVSLDIININSTGNKNAEIEILENLDNGSRIAVLQKTVNVGINTMEFNSKSYQDLSLHISGFTSGGNTISTTFKDVQVAEKSNDNTYIEHEEQLITFPLAQGQKLYKGDYPADDGIHHIRKQLEFDGTENEWALHNDADPDKTSFIYNSSALNLKKNGDILCTHYKKQNFYANKVNTISQTDFWGIKIIIITEKMTLQEFKTFLAEQKQAGTPVVVECELAEEETEAYTEEQQTAHNQLQNAKTYKLVTNAYTEKAKIQMNYIVDTKTYVDNEINSIKEQINTINELLSTTNTSALLLDNLQTDLESEVL